MPRGFVGQPASSYLTKASTAHDQAGTNSSQIATRAPASASATARLQRTRDLPFEPNEAFSGGSVPTGRGDSSNIVVRHDEYDTISRTVSQADDRIGECMYNISNEIEALCQTDFVLPDAVPRCLNISNGVKDSLGQFRGVTEDTLIQTRNFAREIANIGF